ncbi:MAG: ATP-binding protein [Gammaproteobacteria bacterium]|nr:ATP-binding protein [Gammaproteobacteria bacterium]
MTKTLFAKTAVIISTAMLFLLLFTVAVSSYFISDSSDKASAEELASLMILTAKTYTRLPEGSRREFVQKLRQDSQLILGHGDERLARRASVPNYYLTVGRMISAKLRSPVSVAQQLGKENRYWIDIKLDGQLVRLGIGKPRSALPMPIIAIVMMFAIALVAIVTSLYLIKRVTNPLEKMAIAAKTIGQGRKPEPLSETGPQEFADTAKAFNQMSKDVHDLLENRTILLSGISHDIRTPLTRLALATEMLPKETDEELQDELRNVHRDIERIVNQYLSLTRSLDEGDAEHVVFADLLSDVIAELTFKTDQEVITNGDEAAAITTSAYALRAVVVNILSNALRYGLEHPVEVCWQADSNSLEISFLDRGPGIPDEQKEAIFQPFYRLEGSRNVATGGVGLGLAIVNQIVKKYDWKIEVRDRIGGGTEIVIVAPNV